MKYTAQLFVSAVIVFALVGAGCFSRPLASQTPGATPPQAVDETVNPVALVQLNGGTATVTRGSETDEAPDGLELMPGDTIEAKTGIVQLVYPDAGVSQVEAGSRLTVLPDGEGNGSVFAQIELTAGSIWTRFERLLGSDERFSVSANGVVATVRGTAFGVSIVNGDADIQVAESDVDVNVLEARREERLAARALRLSAGSAMRVSAAAMKQMDAIGKKSLVRKLSDREKKMRGFAFAVRKIDAAILKGPSKRMRLKRAMAVPEALRNRLDPKMLERIIRMNTLPTFVSPTLIRDRMQLFEAIIMASSTR